MSGYITKIAKKIIRTDKEGSGREEEKSDSVVAYKLNINSVFNKEEYTPSRKGPEATTSGKSDKEFTALLEEPIVDLEKLKSLAWHGIPKQFRGKTWKLLLKYLPQNKSNREASIKRKRDEYFEFVTRHVDNIEESHLEESEKKTRKIIWADVLRTQPDIKLFHFDIIQKMLNNILCVWHCRNPASGYVQGINDIMAPFIVAFLTDYVTGIDPYTYEVPDNFVEQLEKDKNILREVEADTYWCLTKIVEPIIENYTKQQPLVTKSLNKIEEIIKRVDNSLHDHFVKEDVSVSQFAFRWQFCLLIREFPLNLGLRLFDTYISDDEGFISLHIFVCAAMLLKWTKTLKKMSFNEMIPFLQNLPTKDWNEDDVSMLLSESYVFQAMFSKK